MSGKVLRTTPLKIVILGDVGVGKSSLMHRFVSNRFDEHIIHTLGIGFLNKDVEINGENYTLQIWDTVGQEKFRTLQAPFYRGTDICLLTYAVNNRTSFRQLQVWKNEFLYYADIREDTKFPFIIVGNKSDVPAKERAVSQLEMQTWCNENSVAACIETSARTASNVQDAFHMAVQRWLRREKSADKDPCIFNDSVDLRRRRPTESRNSCC